jgi:hypothetical protein
VCTFLVFDVSLCLGVCLHCWGFVSSGAGVGTGGGATVATGPELTHEYISVGVMEDLLCLL